MGRLAADIAAEATGREGALRLAGWRLGKAAGQDAFEDLAVELLVWLVLVSGVQDAGLEPAHGSEVVDAASEGELVWPEPRPLCALTMPVLVVVGERDTDDLPAGCCDPTPALVGSGRVGWPVADSRSGRPAVVTDDDVRGLAIRGGSERESTLGRRARNSSVARVSSKAVPRRERSLTYGTPRAGARSYPCREHALASERGCAACRCA